MEKRASARPLPARRLAVAAFLAVSFLLLAAHPGPSVADQDGQSAAWQFNIERDKQRPSTIAIRNRCTQPHKFRVKSKIKYLRFERPTEAILIGPGSTQQVGMVFDSTGLRPRLYKDKLTVECVDCKEERGCSQDRDELAVAMTVQVPQIHSWCVVARASPITRASTCKIVEVYPNHSPGPCKGNYVTIPNDGRPAPKIGDTLSMETCMGREGPGPNPITYFCVEVGIDPKPLAQTCKVISVKSSKSPCGPSFLTYTNISTDGKPLPKVGDTLPLKVCLDKLGPAPRRGPDVPYKTPYQD